VDLDKWYGDGGCDKGKECGKLNKKGTKIYNPFIVTDMSEYNIFVNIPSIIIFFFVSINEMFSK